MQTPLINEIKRHNYNIIVSFIEHNEPFRLIMHNNNDWDNELPKGVMKAFPAQLPIDFSQEVIEHTYIEYGSIFMKMMFGDEEFNKQLFPDDILAVLDMDTNVPYAINRFNEFQPAPKEITESYMLNRRDRKSVV